MKALLAIERHAMRFPCMGIVFFGAFLIAQATSVRADDVVNHDVVLEKIETSLPADWSVAETKAEALPEGHYWGLKYEGKKGLEVVLQGPRDRLFHWKDKYGEWHSEPVAKEAIRLWLMPAKYEESWRRHFVVHRPVTAKLLFSGPTVRVYSHPSSQTIAVERVDEIIKVAKSTTWQKSHPNAETLSWTTWNEDLQRALRSQ